MASAGFRKLWPTATAAEGGYNQGGGMGRVGPKRPTLMTMGKLWPTATAGDAGSSGSAGYGTESGRHEGTTLTDAAVRLWATPQARDGKGEFRNHTKGGTDLSHQARQTKPTGETGMVLNPGFVEALMGFPLGWTAFEPSATQSCRRWWRQFGLTTSASPGATPARPRTKKGARRE